MHLTEWQESGERYEEYCIDENKVTLALEYMTPIKGIDTSAEGSEAEESRHRKRQRIMTKNAEKWR